MRRLLSSLKSRFTLSFCAWCDAQAPWLMVFGGLVLGLTVLLGLFWLGDWALLWALVLLLLVAGLVFSAKLKALSAEEVQRRALFWRRYRLWLAGFAVVFLGLVAVYAESFWWAKQQGFPMRYALLKPLFYVGYRPLPERVVIPAGSFQMGDDVRYAAQPVHAVTIAEPFEMGKYEVTFLEYDYYIWQQQLKDDQGALAYPNDAGWGRDQRPVINVSWHDAQGYVSWLSEQTGLSCRLPSEAEWEYAARAGTTTDYWWGDEASHEYANYGKDECCDGLAEGRDQWENTAPVSEFPANPWGLYDTLGNVEEWVADCWHNNYENASTDGSAWEMEKGQKCEARVLRGGSWYYVPSALRSAFRFNFNPAVVNDFVGFRVVCSHPPSEH